jgi:hypothetical protein
MDPFELLGVFWINADDLKSDEKEIFGKLTFHQT